MAAVKLSQLRVSSDMDSSGYVRGMAEKVAADQRGIASGEALGQSLAQQDVAAGAAGGALGRLSRIYIDGYGTAAKFHTAVASLQKQVELGAPAEKATLIYQGLVKQFGMVASASELAGKGNADFARIIGDVNARVEQNVVALQRAAQAQEVYGRSQASLINSAQAINQRLAVNDNFGGASRAQDIAAYGDELDKLRAKFNPVFAAQQQYKAELQEIQRAAKVGAIGEKERAEAVMNTKVAFVQQINSLRGVRDATDDTAESTRRGAAATGLARHELINLSRQAQDVVVSLGSGQGIGTVLLQQGSQIADVFASSRATVGSFFRQAASWLGGFLTAGRLAFAGVAAGIGAAVMALSQYASAQREIDGALFGAGRASGATRDSINANALGSASTFGLSVSEAREVGTVLAATGKIGVEAIGAVTKQAHDLAIVMGSDVKTAAQELAKIYSDPVRGMDELNARLGFLDARTADYIRTLSAQGERQKAIMALTEASAPALARAVELTSGWARAWNAVSNWASNAYDWVGRTLNRAATGGTMEEQLAAVERQLEGRSRPQGGGMQANAQKKAYDDLVAKQAQLRAAIEATAKASADAAASQRSLATQAIIDGVTQEVQARRDLENEIENVAKAMADPAFAKHTRDLDQATQALERLKGAYDTLLTPMERETKQHQLSLDAIKARSPAQQADIAARQKELELTGQKLSADERATAIENARRLALAQSSFQMQETARERQLSGEQSVQSAQLEIQLIGKTIGEQTRLRADLQTRQQLEQEAARNRTSVDEAEYARLQKINAELGKKALGRARADIGDRLNFETQTIGLSQEDAQIAERLRDIYGNDIPAALNSAEAGQMRYNNRLREARDAAGDFAQTLLSGLLSGRNAMESLSGAASQLISQLASKQLDKFMSGDFSSSGAGLGSMQGVGTVAAAGVSGYKSGSPLGGALGGAMAGFSVGGVPGAIVGGIVGLAGGLLGGADKKKKEEEARQAQVQAAKDAWAKMEMQWKTFIGSLSGTNMGSVQQSIDAVSQQAGQYIKAIAQAYDMKAGSANPQEIIDTNIAFDKFVQRTVGDFAATWYETVKSMQAGIGLDSPFAKAFADIRKLAADVQGFVSDTQAYVGDQVELARSAARDYLLTLLDTPKALSDVQSSIQEMNGRAAALKRSLVDLGMSAGEAAAAIDSRLAGAMATLRTKFTDDLQRAINGATDKGYINDLADLFKQRDQNRADAAALGLDPGLVEELFKVRAQEIVNGAGLIDGAFTDLIALFPSLAGVVTESADVIETQMKEMQQIAKGIRSYLDQIKLGGLSTLSPAEQLAASRKTYEDQLALAQSGDREAMAGITGAANPYIEQLRSFYGPSQAYGEFFAGITAELEALAKRADLAGGQGTNGTSAIDALAYRRGGIVGAYAGGGMVGNGLWDQDSVLARYAGGGHIGLAGGEGIISAPATAAIGGRGVIDFVNRNRALPGSGDNREVVNELRAVRAELAAARRENGRMSAAIANLLARGNEATQRVASEVSGHRGDDRLRREETRVRNKSVA